jgi:acyl carrier protein
VATHHESDMQTHVTSERFKERLTTFIVDEVATADEPIAGDTDLLLSGLVDSLGVVMVSDWIQDQLSIEIDPVDIVLENFQTVDAMVAYAESRGAVLAP